MSTQKVVLLIGYLDVLIDDLESWFQQKENGLVFKAINSIDNICQLVEFPNSDIVIIDSKILDINRDVILGLLTATNNKNHIIELRDDNLSERDTRIEKCINKLDSTELKKHLQVLLNAGDSLKVQTNNNKNLTHEISKLLSQSIKKENELQMQLEGITSRLKDFEKSKGEFISMTSHEIRTPLAGIIGLSQTLLSKDIEFDESERERFIRIIESEGKRLNELLTELSAFTKIESGIKETHFDLFDINNLIKDSLQSIAIPKEMNLTVNYLKNSVIILVDKNLIMQVISIIFDNAIKYSTGKGTITVNLADKDDQIIIAISDTGPGISKQDLPKIFNDFYRTRSAKSAKIPGSGLGLSIVKAIINLHKGNVWAESEPGKGSAFYLALPKKHAQSLFKNAA